MLQCERLYNDVMKEARDKLGPDHPLTTKVTLTFISLSFFCSFQEIIITFKPPALGVSTLKLPQLGPAFYRSPGGGILGLIFTGHVPLACQNPYPFIAYPVARNRPHLSHFWENVILPIPT